MYIIPMNTISITNLRNNISLASEEPKKKDYLLLLKRGKPVSALVNLDFLEDLLALANHHYLEDIRQAREQYEKGEYFSFDEVFGDL